jgi:1,2-dihydroxy-3-keto-5-methylthiopentene dioxygenase
MAQLDILTEHRTLTDPAAIGAYLAGINIGFAQWTPREGVSETASPDEILAAYAPEIRALSEQGGYVTADVIDIHPTTPNIEALLAKFDKEHWHDEDEVRFTIAGRGMFYIHPQTGPVVKVTVTPGDLLVVPKGTLHWFTLGPERRIRTIRLFQDPTGWTPHYTGAGTEAQAALLPA